MTDVSKPDSDGTVIVLEAGRADAHYWRDLWRYKGLMFFLAWRDVKVRYKQAMLGALWALIQPAVTMVIFTFVFGKLAGIPGGNVPYPLLVLAGLLPWQLFSAAFSGAGGSVVSNANLVSKVYFPRLVVPLSALGVALVDFLLALGLYAVIAVWYGLWPTWRIFLLPAFLLLGLITALGAGLWLTSLTVKYRDFRFITPFILQVGIFVTPVGYRTDIFPNWRDLLALNPLTGVISGFRWCLLAGDFRIDPYVIVTSIVTGGILLWTGIWYFRRTERSFADTI